MLAESYGIRVWAGSQPLCKQFEFVTRFVIQSVSSLSEDGNKTKIPRPSLLKKVLLWQGVHAKPRAALLVSDSTSPQNSLSRCVGQSASLYCCASRITTGTAFSVTSAQQSNSFHVSPHSWLLCTVQTLDKNAELLIPSYHRYEAKNNEVNDFGQAWIRRRL